MPQTFVSDPEVFVFKWGNSKRNVHDPVAPRSWKEAWVVILFAPHWISYEARHPVTGQPIGFNSVPKQYGLLLTHDNTEINKKKELT